MKYSKRSIHKVLWKYKSQQPLSFKEETLMNNWVAASVLRQQLFDEISNDDYWQHELVAFQAKDGDPVWNIIGQRLDDLDYFEKNKKGSVLKYISIAACVLVVSAFIGVYMVDSSSFNKGNKHTTVGSVLNTNEEVLPASLKAELKLGDGSVVRLDEKGRKMLSMERYGMFISAGEGSLEYKTDMSTKVEHHTLSTPYAAQFKLKLPDGTMVWLNAGSSIRYPTAFDGNVREVELKGEGYFEVAKMPSKKFIVHVDKSSINVLGTHFNVNAYDNDKGIVTTLLEGSVMVKTLTDSAKLVPGEEAIVADNKSLNISKGNTDVAIGWKNKLFRFQDAPIPEIMKQISRWYNVKVVFEGQIAETFTGILPRDLTLGQILAILDSGGNYSFTVKDKTVVVSP